MHILVLFSNQLFHPDLILESVRKHNIEKVVALEDPVFFGDRKGAPGVQYLRLNKLRIAYQHRVFTEYVQQLKVSLGNIPIVVHAIEDTWGDGVRGVYGAYGFPHKIFIFDPMDHLLMKRLQRTQWSLTILNTPAFLLSHEDIEEYKGGLRHAPFYDFVKDKLRILVSETSHDKENRNAFPKKSSIHIPPPYVATSTSASDWENTIAWVNHHNAFARNPGVANLDVLRQLPTTHVDAKKWLQKFVKERLPTFGKYQDAIVKGEDWMFHSGLSIFLNFGLLLPTDVIKAVRAASNSIPMASYEGFIRQLIGWREFARLYYVRVPAKEYRKNVFHMQNAGLAKYWYDGSATWMPPIVRNTIQDAFTVGYLHHIRRLMIMSNYMTLCHVHPDRVFQWMYEFSLDSWDWVMVFNVYSMGTWSDGGLAMRKPYISGAAYVQKMAREPRGPWVDHWNDLFKQFLRKHQDVLVHTQLAGLVRKHT